MEKQNNIYNIQFIQLLRSILYIYICHTISAFIHRVTVICMCYQGVKSRASECFDRNYIHVYKSLEIDLLNCVAKSLAWKI